MVGGNVNVVAGDLHQYLPPPPSVSPLHQLPSRPDLIGRDGELVDLETAIGSAGKSVCLQGMGGVGKSVLAVALAYRVMDRWPDAQLLLDLRGADPEHRPPVPPPEVMGKVVQAFHPTLPLPPDLESLTPLYRSVLADAGRVLLLLDNVADAAQIEGLLPPPNCLLLATSRHQFTLPGVAAYPLDCLSPDRACAVLLARAPRLGKDAPAAAALCGYLPLALRVFAGVVGERKLTPVANLLASLRSGRDHLSRVEAAFAVSDEQLPAELCLRWRLLSVFPASFTLTATTHVWMEKDMEVAREGMQTLVNTSLVEWSESTGRFRLHDLVRQYCAARISPEQAEAARARHAQNYIIAAQRTDALYREGADASVQALADFDAIRPHLEAAFEWLSSRPAREAADQLVTLVNSVTQISSLRFQPREWIRWLEAEIAAARVVGRRDAEGAALGNLGQTYYDLGETRRAIGFHVQQLKIAREIGNRGTEASALGNLGLACAGLNRPRRAIVLYARQLAIAREIGDRNSEGKGLGNLGLVYAELGERRRAISYYEQQLTIARDVGDRCGEGAALGNMGIAYKNLDEPLRAIELYGQQLVIVREIGDRRGEGNTLANLASAFWVVHRRSAAIANITAALAIFESLESPYAERARSLLKQWQREAQDNSVKPGFPPSAIPPASATLAP